MAVRKESLKYLSGYGNLFSSEALVNALPKGQNAPQKAPYGLIAEQVWFYRIRPGVCHTPNKFESFGKHEWHASPFVHPCPPEALRWSPAPALTKPVDFVNGVSILATNGSPQSLSGGATGTYTFNQSMSHIGRYMQNSDADVLLVPTNGTLQIDTEHGRMEVEPLEIGLIPRGIRFQINKKEDDTQQPTDNEYRGYILENYGAHFVIPDLGPIGSSTGLAHPRHFLSPTACWDDEKKGPFELVNKFQGNMWTGRIEYSPLDVVAWQGNYAPSKYDLRLFCTVNSVSFDHPDPSIFTVLTSPTSTPGLANMDFVVFPPRWVAMENSFRPPWYHRNVMSEFMGLIKGVYDAKPKDGKFIVGASSLHNCLTPHGPDYQVYIKSIDEDTTKPVRYRDTMAFMFESSLVWCPTQDALNGSRRDTTYAADCWIHPFKPTYTKGDIQI